MVPVDGDFIRRVAARFSGAKARAQDRIVGAVGPVFAATLQAYDIDSVLRIAHFTAQVAHESAGFRTTEEFASGAAYERRMDLGNHQQGDGARFKGRGLLQLTGRTNYRRLGELLGLPLEDEPRLAADPVVSLKIACEYWKDRGINDPADRDDLRGVTRLVNGGVNGLEDRRTYLERAKAALAATECAAAAPETVAATPELRQGSSGEAVGRLQALLRAKGLAVAADERFGPATEKAAKAFQAGAGLEADGIVGRKTWAALTA